MSSVLFMSAMPSYDYLQQNTFVNREQNIQNSNLVFAGEYKDINYYNFQNKIRTVVIRMYMWQIFIIPFKLVFINIS